jgi:leucyl aminopeptidase
MHSPFAIMTVKQILALLDAKNQNLPTIKLHLNTTHNDLVVVPLFEGEEKKTKKHFPSLRKAKDLSGKKGETTQVLHKDQLFWFVGMGKKDEADARVIRRFYGTHYLAALKNKPKTVGMICPPEWLTSATIGVHVAALDPAMLKPTWSKEKKAPPEIIFIDPAYGPAKRRAIHEQVKEGQVIAEGKNMVRILGALPPNRLDQKTYADVAMALAKKHKITARRCSKKELKKYELLNAVSLGSAHPSELLIFRLDPPKKTGIKTATAVIGKGICYDSGGLIGKQDHMKSMKEDMAGSAITLATAITIIKNKWQIKESTYFLMAIAENLMGAKAMRADDVWTAGDGQTVEIAHTDAEGRLVLADAICYIKHNFKNVEKFYTIATLTGSCMRAFGDLYTGMVCSNEKQAEIMIRAGEKVGDYMAAAPWNLEYNDRTGRRLDHRRHVFAQIHS